MEDSRHVAVECFYAVDEVAPTAQKVPFFSEVPPEGAYWGITRSYPAGTKDRHVVSDGGVSESGVPVTRLDTVQEPVKPVRLLEQTAFSVDCCKRCRGEFLAMFGTWSKGELVGERDDRPGADIPVRVNGATVMITEVEWREHRRRQEAS
ncbi:MAG: hypothetical protein AB7F35_01150 [Acetobacteraceae bacterium]